MPKKTPQLNIKRSTVSSPAALTAKLQNLNDNQKVLSATELAASDKAANTKKIKSTGVVATRMWGDVFNEEYISDLKGPIAAITFEKMLRSDYQVGLLETSIMGVIKAAQYSFSIPNVKNGEAHKDLCEWQWKHGFNKTADENLNDLGSHIFFGHAVFEPLDYEPYTHPKFGAIWRLHTLGFRDQSSITGWRMDSRGDILAAHQQTNYTTPFCDTWMPGENLIVLTEKRKGGNVEGRSVLRLAYGPYWRKNVYYKLLSIGLEKSALGLIVITVPPGKLDTAEETAFIEAVQNYVAHENAYLKKTGTSTNDKFEGFDVEIITMDFKAEAVVTAIRLEDTNIAKCGAAAFSELGQGGNGGAYSLGVADIDFFFSMVTGRIRYIAEKMQRVWNDLIVYNFGEQKEYPEMKGELTEKVGEELARILNYYYNMGVYTPQPEDEAFLRKRHNMPELKIAAASEPKEPEPIPAELDPNNPDNQPVNAAPEDEPETVDGETEPEDEGQNPAQDSKAKKNKMSLSKQPPAFVKKAITGINIKEFTKQLEVLTDDYNKDVGSALQSVQDKYMVDLVNKLKNNPGNPLKAVSEIDFGFTRPLKEKIEGSIINSMYAGKKQGKEVIKAKKGKSNMSLSALASIDSFSPLNKKWIKNTTVITSTTLLDTLKKQALLTAKTKLDQGASDDETAFAVKQAMDVWRGNVNNIGAGAIIPSAVDTGRDEAYVDEGLKINGFIYVNDDPVTAICQWMSGRTVEFADPDAERFTPPNHWGCKSVKIPILSDETQPETWDGWNVPGSILAMQETLSNKNDKCPKHWEFYFIKEAV